MKKLLLLILGFSAFFSNSRAISPADKEKLAVEALTIYFECVETQNKGLVPIIQKTMNEKNQVNALVFEQKNTREDFMQVIIDNGYRYSCEFLRENDEIKSVTIKRNCKPAGKLEFNYFGDLYVSLNNDNYLFEYNSQNIIEKVIIKNYENYNGYWLKKFVKVDHTPDGKLSKISKMISIGKGKTVKDIVESFSFVEDIREFTGPVENRTNVHMITYRGEKKKKNEPDIITNEGTLTISTENNIETYTVKRNENIHVTREYKNGDLVRSVYTDGRSTLITDYIRINNKMDRIVMKETKTDGSFVRHDETLVDYTLNNGQNPENNCSYLITSRAKSYDKANDLIYESENGKSRSKINGVWTAWKMEQY